MNSLSYREKLRKAQKTNDSWVCVGLDPDPARMPDLPELNGTNGLATFCSTIVEATHDAVCAFKPNLAFFLAYGPAGLAALEAVLESIPAHIPVLLDAKCGDIGNTQVRYGQAAFGTWGMDAMTVSPYVGQDAVLPLLEAYPGVGLYVLARTSNSGAQRFQDHPGDGFMLYQNVVEAVRGWQLEAEQSTLGLVVGATYPGELESIREAAPELPFLIPGIGAQGGNLEAAARYGATQDGLGPLISASRSILYASGRADYAQAARQAVLAMREAINTAQQEAG
jgi:orotidine-5'-phosphate decarboxylase